MTDLKPGERLRGRPGQRARARRLARTHGLCEHCLAEGRTTIATVVDHTHPLALGGLDVDDNTRNLCDPHHRKVTAEQFGQDVARVTRGCDRRGRPIDPSHPWSAARRASAHPPGGVESRQGGGGGHRASPPYAPRGVSD